MELGKYEFLTRYKVSRMQLTLDHETNVGILQEPEEIQRRNLYQRDQICFPLFSDLFIYL